MIWRFGPGKTRRDPGESVAALAGISLPFSRRTVLEFVLPGGGRHSPVRSWRRRCPRGRVRWKPNRLGHNPGRSGAILALVGLDGDPVGVGQVEIGDQGEM
jgi:hypothetical protein